MRWRWLGIASVACALGLHCDTCTQVQDTSEASVADGAQEGPTNVTVFDGSRPCDSPPFDGVPVGWVPDSTYPLCCGFFRPVSSKDLPQPLQWMPCDAAAKATLPTGATCQQLSPTWNSALGTEGISADGYFDIARQRVYLSLGFVISPTSSYAIVAEPDGPVWQAEFQASTSVCRAQPVPPGSLAGGHFVWPVVEYQDQREDGFIGGAIEDIQTRVGARWNDQLAHATIAGDAGIVDLSSAEKMSLYSWVDASLVGEIASQASDPDHLQIAFPTFSGDVLLWTATNGMAHKIRQWSQDGGTVDLVDYLDGGNVQHGAGDIGTDNTSLFWVEGFGIQQVGPYDAAAYYTSPTTMALQGRRLTAASTGYVGATSVVGCGLGAHAEPRSFQIVRLADGVSWTLGWSSSWSFQAPIAITCSEVFVRVATQGRLSVARIALSSLGVGVLPQ